MEGGISFSVVRPTLGLWEVGIDQEPLTMELVAQRGYRLLNDSLRTVLEVPIFSVGYTYEVREPPSPSDVSAASLTAVYLQFLPL